MKMKHIINRQEHVDVVGHMAMSITVNNKVQH